MDKAFHVANYGFGGNKPGAPLTWEQLERLVYPLGRDLPLNVARADPSDVTQSHRYTGTDLQELVELAAKAAGVEAEKGGEYKISAAQLLSYPPGKELAEKLLQRYVLKKLSISCEEV